MAFQPFGNITQNNFKLIPLDTPVGTRVKCILRAYKEGFDDIVLETLPVTISQRPGLYGSDVYISDRDNGPQIQTIIENNFVFAVDDIVGEDGITYQFYVEYPVESGLLESGTGYPGISGDYGASLPSWVVDGVKVEHRPYFNGMSTGLTGGVGDPTAYGYDHTAIVQWTCRNATIMDEDAIDGYYYVSLQAYHHNGIEKVEFQLNDGPVLEVTEQTNHPVDNILEYICKININDSNLKTLNEVRALVYPNSGQKVLVQGFGKYPRLYYGGDITGGSTGELVDPTIDNDYVSFNTNGDNLYYTSLFLYKRQEEHNIEIFFDYENGSDELGDGSESNPYKTLGVGIQKYSTEILNNNTINERPYLDGCILKLKPGEHVIGGYDNQAYYSNPELGKLFPVVITSSDSNNRAVILGSTGGPAPEGRSPLATPATIYNVLIKNLDIKENGTTYLNNFVHTISFNYPNLNTNDGYDGRGRYFSTLHQDNLLIEFPNETRPYQFGVDPLFPENIASDGELIFKWGCPHTEGTGYNPNYPPPNYTSVAWKHIHYVPGHGIQLSSKTNSKAKFYAQGAEFGGMFARGNVDYSSFGSRGYVCQSSVNNKCYWCSIEVPTEVIEEFTDIQDNISPTAFFWTGTHADHYQPGDGAFAANDQLNNKYNSYAKILSYNKNIHRNYVKKSSPEGNDGVSKSQFYFDGDGAYRKIPGGYFSSSKGYKWEVGQGVYTNVAVVKNEHLNSGNATSFSMGGAGKAALNFYIEGNTFGSSVNLDSAMMAAKSWTWKNNFDADGNIKVEYGDVNYKPYGLGIPANNMYSPFYLTNTDILEIPYTIGVTYLGNYEESDPGSSGEREYIYPFGPNGYDTYYGLDVYNDFQVLNIYDGITAPSDVSSDLIVKFNLNHDEENGTLFAESLEITDGYLLNMQRLIPFGCTLSYKWYENDIEISGETGPILSGIGAGDEGSEFSCEITARELLPGISFDSLRTGSRTNTIRIKQYNYPDTGNWVAADPILIYNDGTDDYYGFDTYVKEKNNSIPFTVSGIVHPIFIHQFRGLIIKADILDRLHYTLMNYKDLGVWRLFNYFSDSNDPGIVKPYRRLVNMDTGASVDYFIGIGSEFIFTGSSNLMENRSRSQSLEGYSMPVKDGNQSTYNQILNILRDAAENNQRVLYAYARVAEELPTIS